MGLFKDFKEDLSQAAKELVPGGEELETVESTDNLVVDTLGEEVDVKSELSKLDGLLEQVNEEPVEKKEPEKLWRRKKSRIDSLRHIRYNKSGCMSVHPDVFLNRTEKNSCILVVF